jgi:hypothetical protein
MPVRRSARRGLEGAAPSSRFGCEVVGVHSADGWDAETDDLRFNGLLGRPHSGRYIALLAGSCRPVGAWIIMSWWTAAEGCRDRPVPAQPGSIGGEEVCVMATRHLRRQGRGIRGWGKPGSR